MLENPRASYLSLLAPIAAGPCSHVPSLPNALEIYDCFPFGSHFTFGMSPLYEAFPEGSVIWVAARDVASYVSSFLHRNGIDGRYTSVHAVEWMEKKLARPITNEEASRIGSLADCIRHAHIRLWRSVLQIQLSTCPCARRHTKQTSPKPATSRSR